MRSLEQIVRDNGGDDTPALDTHNLTGRAFPEGVETDWVPYWSADDDADYDEPLDYDALSYEAWLGSLDCE